MKRSRTVIRDRLGRFAPSGTVRRNGRRADAPRAPFVLEKGGRKNRREMRDSQQLINAYGNELLAMKKGPKTSDNVIAWNGGRIMAQSKKASPQKVSGMKRAAKRKK